MADTSSARQAELPPDLKALALRLQVLAMRKPSYVHVWQGWSRDCIAVHHTCSLCMTEAKFRFQSHDGTSYCKKRVSR